MSNEQGGRGPDYSMATLLRGFPGFEDYYQGLSVRIPVGLFPYGQTQGGRDGAAAKNYGNLSRVLNNQVAGVGPTVSGPTDGATSPNLLGALPCTLGSNMIFYLPRAISSSPGFTYQITWRLRTLAGYDQTSVPYHDTFSNARYQDPRINTDEGWVASPPVFDDAAASRSIIMSCSENIRLTQPAPADPNAGLGLQYAKDLGLQVFGEWGYADAHENGTGDIGFWNNQPIVPFVGGNANVNPVTGRGYAYGEVGQNPMVSQAAASGSSVSLQRVAAYARTSASHVTYTTKAKGDEVLVKVFYEYPLTDLSGTYDFNVSGLGFQMSSYFGRGGYDDGDGAGNILFPNGIPFGVYVIQGF